MKTDKDYENLGVQIAALLNLEIKENGRVDTAFGDKTMIGLGKTFERMLDDFNYGIVNIEIDKDKLKEKIDTILKLL